MKKQLLLFVSALLLLTGLSACNSKPDMPMEITVDGYTIVLGRTTVKDLTDLGYEVNITALPDTAKESDDTIPFYLSMDQGAGKQIYVTVRVPWSGGTNINKEQAIATTEGVFSSVTTNLSSTAKEEVVYHGVNIQDITFKYAADEWGCTEKKGTHQTTYTLTAQRGLLTLESTVTSNKEFGSIKIQLNDKEFAAMQK